MQVEDQKVNIKPFSNTPHCHALCIRDQIELWYHR